MQIGAPTLPTCLIDVRCLQDPPFAERGIGRHAKLLLSHARIAMPRHRLVGIADGALPELPASARAMLDAVTLSAYTGALTGPTCFVQLSPMTHDPLFVARLLHHPDIPSAAVVYDFIPLDKPDRYLPTPALSLDYHLALRWLARYQRFMPISVDAGERLTALLGITESRIVVTGAPLAPAFEALGRHATGQATRHVLVIGGSDPRKNPECAIQAHACTEWLQAECVPVIVTGEYQPAWLADCRSMAAALGGNPELVQAPGHVDEPALLSLYANALCVVAPSKAEGFSLPVVEAMAAGIPALASDIPAHRELLTAGLFPADDFDALAVLLRQAADPAWRSMALARQAAIWPRFRAASVAARFWSGVADMAPARPPATPLRRPRVAMLSPLPPDASGVADYTAATCIELGRRVELHLFTPTRNPAPIANVASIQPLSALPLVSSRFDRVIGVIGNSVYHLDILKLVLRYGGALILHDGRLLDLYAGHMGLERTVAMAEAEIGRALQPDELINWREGAGAPVALILAEIAAVAEPLITHSRAGQEQIAQRYGRNAIRLPFCQYRVLPEAALTQAARQAARSRLGFRPDAVVLASFGYVHPSKAPVDCIWALWLLRSWGIDASLALVGSPMMPLEPLEALLAKLGLAQHVRFFPRFVSEEAYRDHLVGADVAIQLRITGVGSVSGALADCVSAGLPTVASATLWDAIDAPDFVRPVPDNPSPVLVAEAVAKLLALGDTAASRRAYAATHGFDTYADALCTALALP